MKNVMRICEEISNAKIKKAINILIENKDNEKLSKVLDFVFNPYITSGISDKKYNKDIKAIPTITFRNLLEVLDYIKKNNTGSDEVLCNIQNYIKDKPENIKKFIHDIITKQLKLGIGTTSINKAYGNKFIPTFDIQLADKYYNLIDEVRKANKPFTLTLKLDGHRCMIVKHKDDVRIYARSGQLIQGCEEIEKVIKSSKHGSFVLDGEILAKVEDNSIASKDRYRKTSKMILSDGIKNNIEFHAFDFLTYKEFKTKTNERPYKERRKILSEICSELIEWNKNCPIILLPVMYEGQNYDVIEELLAKVRKKKLEGLMLNINDAYYEFKRTKSLLKIKVMEDMALRILKVKEGSGRLEGTCGRIICRYKDNKVSVGSGLSDEDRKNMWEHPENYIGKLARIQYFEETTNENGEPSLRFPVYLGLEEDREYGDCEEDNNGQKVNK